MKPWVRIAAGAAWLCAAWASAAAAKTPAVEAAAVPAVPAEVAKALDSVQTLSKQDDTSEDFGAGVALSDRYAVIGAPDETVGGVKSGVVYVFERYPTSAGAQYRLLDRIQSPPSPPPMPGPPPVQTVDRFGQSVAVFGDTIVIGAPGIAGMQPSIGRVRFYVRDPRALAPPFFNEVELVEPSPLETPEIVNPAGARFGHVVGLNGPFLFVGAPEAALATGPSTSVQGGAVIVYKCTTVRDPAGLRWNCAKQTVLRAPDLTPGQQFGFSLAAQKPPLVPDLTLVIGAPAGPNCPLPPPGPCTPVPTGATYAFTGIDATWNFRKKYTPAAGAAGDRYGHAVAHVGPSVAVGAPNDDGQKGTVRILEGPDPASLMENTTLRAPNGTEMMHFGGTISLFNQHIAIAAPDRTVGANARQGAVFLHERIAAGQWVLREEVTRPFQAAGANFGAGLALTGDILVAGEPDGPTGDLAMPPPPGRAYVYFLGRTISRVTNAAGTPGDDRFGSAVARDGDVMVVGLPGKESGATPGVGVVQVFLRNAAGAFPAVPDQTIQPPPGEVVPNLAFGASVALSANGSELVVGAPGALVNGAASAGAAFVFPRTQTTYATALPPVLELVQPDLPVANAQFGASVDIGPEGTPIVVGAPGSANGGRGGVYVFEEAAARGKDGAVAKSYSGSSVAPGAGSSIGDKWGTSVSTDGTTVAAGATEADDAGSEDGYVTLIGDTVDGYATSATIDAPADDASAIGDKQSFGASVDIDDGTLVVGAPLTDAANDNSDELNTDEGSAYAYAVDAGTASDPTQLSAPSGALGDKWGTSVAVSNGTVASGGPGTDVANSDGTTDADEGAVITFECDDDSCDFDQTMYGLDASSGEAVGSSIAFDGEEFVVGAPDADPNGTNAGAIYTGADLYSSAAVANDDSGLVVTEDSSGNVLSVVANDTASLDSGPAVVIGVGTPSHGAASVGANGANVLYTPAANYCGPDAFTYSLDGGSVGNVSLTVSCVNDAPIAVGSIANQSAAEDATVNLATAASFSDIDDATLAYQAAGLPAGLAIDASGTITGTIGAGASSQSPYAVTITARDAANASAQQQFQFTVTAPAAGGDLIYGNGFE